MRQGRRGMAQRHVGYCEVTAWNGLRRRERGQGDLGDVRTSAGAEPGLATIVGWRLFVRRACIPLSGALLIVAGNPGARGHADLLRRGCLLDMHAGRSHRTANPVEHEGDTEKQAKEDQRRQHRVTLSHAPTSRV